MVPFAQKRTSSTSRCVNACRSSRAVGIAALARESPLRESNLIGPANVRSLSSSVLHRTRRSPRHPRSRIAKDLKSGVNPLDVRSDNAAIIDELSTLKGTAMGLIQLPLRAAFSAVFGAVLVSACGGGGGEGTGSAAPPAGGSPVGVASVGLKRLDLSNTRYLVTTVASAASATGLARALATTPTGKSTYKMVGTDLVKLVAELNYSSAEHEAKCNSAVGSPEVQVIDATNLGGEFVLLSVTIPVSVSADCTVGYTTERVVVETSTGAVYRVGTVFGAVKAVVPANTLGFNESSTPILLGNDNIARKLSVNSAGALVVTDIASDFPSFFGPGYLAHDGRFVANMAGSFQGIRFADLNYAGFSIIRSENNGYAAMMIDHEGDFVVNGIPGLFMGLYKIDKATGTLSATAKWPSPGTGGSIAPGNPMVTSAFYGLRGRYGASVMDDRCTIYDVTTPEKPWSLYGGLGVPIIGSNPQASLVSGKYAYCVTNARNGFTRQDLSTKDVVHFNTDTLGVLVRSFTLHPDTAMLVTEVLANGDKVYMELDFSSGIATKKGVIEQVGRKVVEVLPIS
jgi:hypothetical protein